MKNQNENPPKRLKARENADDQLVVSVFASFLTQSQSEVKQNQSNLR